MTSTSTLKHEYKDDNSLVEKNHSVHVEVADGHTVQVPGYGEVVLWLAHNDGGTLVVALKKVIYGPGLTQNMFSISQSIHQNNATVIVENLIYLTF